MQKISILLVCLLSMTLSACEPGQIEISEQQLNQYIEAVSDIKDRQLKDIKQGTQTEREQLEQAVKKAGFNNLDSFIETHTDISWALAQNKTEAAYQDLKQHVQGGIDDFSKHLKLDPNLKQQSQELHAEGKKWWQVLSGETKELSTDSQTLIDQNLDKLKQALN